MAQSNNKTAMWYQGNGGTVTNFTRHEAQRFARQLLESQTYRDNLEQRLLKGDLAPNLEAMLWHYAYGKPIEQINLNVNPSEDLTQLSVEELQKRAAKLAESLEEAKAVADAIPGDVVKGPW